MTNTYQIDPAHSNLQFSVRHLMMSNVRGAFTGVSGTVTYDPGNPGAASIEAKIDVATVNTHDETRDGHLKTPDFFDVAQYPHITFRSTKIEKKSNNEFLVTGDLTMHGVTKPVVLQVEEVSDEAQDPWGNTRIGASAKGKIKRSEFGLTWNAALEAGGVMVGDDVKLDFELELVKAKSAAA
ncbi:MAG TPA: YceI family protein [Bryobacteraceae bacterium]|jgi:polyisoprenoid-binding protein YceI|nr:YceI family protein [Bryobacteraceae bacterium]